MAAPTASGSSRPHRPGPERDARARAAEQALVTLTEAVTAGLTRREGLDLVVRAAAGLAGEAMVHPWLIGAAGARLEPAAERGAEAGRRGVPLPQTQGLGEGLVGAVAGPREPIVVASLAAEERRVAVRDWLVDQGLASLAGAPLMRGDRLLGARCVFTSRRRRFTRREVGLLRCFAAHAAVAIENAALLATTTGRLRRLETPRDRPGALAPAGLRHASRADRPPVRLRHGARARGGQCSPPRVGLLQHRRLGAGRAHSGGPGLAASRRGMVVNDYARSPLGHPALPRAPLGGGRARGGGPSVRAPRLHTLRGWPPGRAPRGADQPDPERRGRAPAGRGHHPDHPGGRGWGVELPPDQLRLHGVDRVMPKLFRFEDVREVVASFQPIAQLRQRDTQES